MDFSSPFLTKQIIAYIGNKRRLLGLIYRAVEECIPGAKDGLRFFDAFSGSGIVSRLAKTLNFELFTNDWEHYSYVLSQAFIATNASDMPALFGGWEKFHCLADTLNHLPPPAENEQYIARYYAPASTNIDHADFRTERLFYTHDNALRIDSIRNYIDAHFPAGHGQARQLLIGLLLYEAATHTNTSGVFKAFHKGFGGHGRDALKRILTPVQIRPPALIDSSYPVHVFQADANMLAKELGAGKIDIAYLDPPYNQHQYGSNYHMLNTIALWDKPPAPTTLNAEGVLKAKAGIRRDWIKTRSAYCYADSAVRAFRDLVHNLNARYILISYSTDGLIPFDLMMDVCAARGALKVVTDGYTTYRGGRQSNARLNSNMEFVLIIDTARPARPAHSRAFMLRLRAKSSCSCSGAAIPVPGYVLIFRLVAALTALTVLTVLVAVAVLTALARIAPMAALAPMASKLLAPIALMAPMTSPSSSICQAAGSRFPIPISSNCTRPPN